LRQRQFLAGTRNAGVARDGNENVDLS